MLLAALNIAFADSGTVAAKPFADAIADLGPTELEMPPLAIRATHSGRSIWSRVPDGMAVELALTQYGIPVTGASVITVVNVDGQTRLHWTEIATGAVRLSAVRSGMGEVCTQPVSGGVWGAGSDIGLYEPTPSGEDNVAGSPGFLLVDDDLQVGALVSLAAGDAATMIDVRYDGRLIREVVAVQRSSGTVRVERRKGEERICYLPPVRNNAGE